MLIFIRYCICSSLFTSILTTILTTIYYLTTSFLRFFLRHRTRSIRGKSFNTT